MDRNTHFGEPHSVPLPGVPAPSVPTAGTESLLVPVPATSSIVLQPGERPVPGYVLRSPLGRGGCGVVWRASGPSDFPVALKFVWLGDRTDAPDLRSLELMKQIRHPHLLSQFGAWQQDGYLVLAMELADGDLMDRLREAQAQFQPGIPRDQLHGYLREAALGIDFLNEHRHQSPTGGQVGIQHRDIKPQNLLLVGGSVKVADFGLAKYLENTHAASSGAMTIDYAAPEFFSQKVSDQSDQYSLAVTYCQLRGGRLPFAGPAGDVIAGHMVGEPDLTMLPPEERPAVARALAKLPAERWPSCRAFVEAVATSAAKPPPAPEFAPPPARPRWLGYVAAGLAATLLVVLVALMAMSGGREPEEEPEPRKAREIPVVQTPPERPDGTTAAVEPNRVERRTEAARAARVRGDEERQRSAWAAAVAAYGEAIELDPTDVLARVGRGYAVDRLGGGPTLLADGTAVARLRPDLAAGLHVRALGQLRLGRADLAATDAAEAVRLDPGLTAAQRTLAEALFRAGQHEAALTACEAACAAEPTEPTGRDLRGRLAALRGDHVRAVDEFAEALRRYPVGVSERAECAAARAASLVQLKRFPDAVEDYGEALRRLPRRAEWFGARATVHERLEQFHRALEDYTEAIQVAPEVAVYWRDRGDVYRRLGAFAAAADDYEKMLAREPSAAAYNRRGRARHGLKEYRRAIEDFDEALRLNTRSDRYRAAYLLNRGTSYVELTEYVRAMEDFAAALAINPNDWRAAFIHNERGRSYYRREQYREAIGDYDRGLALTIPEDEAALRAILHGNRGNARARLRDFNGARQDFSRAIELAPRNPVNYESRALVCERLGDREQAQRDRKTHAELKRDGARQESSRSMDIDK